MSATTEAPRKGLEKYVQDAVRAVGEKVSELNDEQRDRAQSAPQKKPGLRGKALGRWILDGTGVAEQEKQARETRELAEATAAHERRSAAAKNGRGSAYPEEIRKAVKRSNEIRGKSHGAGPKQHVHVREVVTKLLGGKAKVTKAGIREASGASSMAELFAIASGEAGREDVAKLRELGSKMGDDPWCKGRHLAGALAAWTEEL